MADLVVASGWIASVALALCCGLPLLLALVLGKRSKPPDPSDPSDHR